MLEEKKERELRRLELLAEAFKDRPDLFSTFLYIIAGKLEDDEGRRSYAVRVAASLDKKSQDLVHLLIEAGKMVDHRCGKKQE